MANRTAQGLVVLVIICANGMGHFIRQLGIWAAVLRLLPLLKVTFMVTEAQLAFQSPALDFLKSLPNVQYFKATKSF